MTNPSATNPSAQTTDEAAIAEALRPDEGWTDLQRDNWPGYGPNFVSGDAEGNRLRVHYYRRDSDGHLVGRAWFGPGTQGPPGHAHGGSMAALLDEVMGTSCWVSGHPVLAASIKIDFRNMIPLGTVATFEGWVDTVNGRKITTRGRLAGPDGTLFAEGEGLFIRMDKFFGRLGDQAAGQALDKKL